MSTFSPGRLAYRFLFEPIGKMRDSLRWGGPINRRRALRGHEAMKVAARDLPPMAEPQAHSGLSVNFLSGEHYWHQTLFCFYSLQLVVDGKVDVTIYDDGSFTRGLIDLLRAKIGWVRVVSAAEAEARLDNFLARDRFPTIRTRRDTFPLMRKFADVHCDSREYRIVLDSDMLFYRTPHALLDWAKAAEKRGIYILDIETAYGYDPVFMSEQVGREIPARVNSGVYGIHGAMVDWDEVERCCKEQLDRFGPHYFQEQALTAMQLSRDAPAPLVEADYIVKPSVAEGYKPSAALHHYVTESRRAYFDRGWRTILALVEASGSKITT